MPDFTISAAETTPAVWTDPPSDSPPAASRLAADPAYAPLYLRVVVPTTLHLTATVGGVAGPADGALGGRLFEAHVVEWSGHAGPPYLTQVSGHTSQVVVELLAGHVGHHLVAVSRPGGGTVGFHFDCAPS